MNALSAFFSLETLDTRLIAQKQKKTHTLASKSRWNSREFKFYFGCMLIVIPLMFKAAIDATGPSNINYPKYARLLSPGWLFNRKVDNSDQQYKFFRDNLILLAIVAFGHIALKRATLSVFKRITPITFDTIFGFPFLFVLHGVNCLRPLTHLAMFFVLSRSLRKHKRVATLLIWLYGISSLFINVKFRLLKYGDMLPILSSLDSWNTGIVKRWDVFYNFTLLRLLSYNLDYIERYHFININPKQKEEQEEKELSKAAKADPLYNDLTRTQFPHSLTDFSFFNYLGYALYAPLFIAGPIITFNDFLYQSRNTLPSITLKRNVIYGLRLVFCVLVMEFLLHFTYVVAASKVRGWEGDSPFQLAMVGLFNLNLIWLKLLIPWRFFRLWSLCDNIDPPENMIRCMNNNFSALQFWRAWHRSFNKWVIRYIYVPMGGSNHRILSSLCVFTFVAIWHDIELKLLLWGWLVVLFLLPEIFASQFFSKYKTQKWYRYVSGFGCVINIWMMMLANLFGFCLDASGIEQFVHELFFTSQGLFFFLLANLGLFIAVQVMFELREEEKRHDVDVKC
ncbi:hypothetical protein ACO0RG_003279 [Hanseniaspora osmophila]